MDVSDYLASPLFARDIETLLTCEDKHELLYHATGRRDITIVEEFQRQALAVLATLKEASAGKSDVVVNTSDATLDSYDGVSLRIHTLRVDERK